ncbi:hypothetical protein PTNB85_09852 [Pyrenophora teres f. teres]|uniref:DUF4045 multi-domain protein n=1 Tax=Pyrenophora teres f. teres TaxID=97479 RepID=A0A6S6VX33_9PLEO|nr:hypothetical protein PTNB85_09852 [Pyrenophora teres f. teres]KAE8868624.1 hypothetical protein PTNB29_02535 [Pyrenophora teres f. teres]CAE7020960.1 hypothetical protein PTTW11_03174 [Pyrenophora teres f. teres]
MASKPLLPSPKPTPTTPAKQARSRKAVPATNAEQGRAGSAGGVLLPKEAKSKPSTSTTKKTTVASTAEGMASPAANIQKRKPRKLNKEPSLTSTDTTKPPTPSRIPADAPSASDLEALKSRVRGLEAKVEELYRAGAISDSRPGRSPRRRGKGRKTSSATQVPTLSTSTRVQEVDDDDDNVEEVVEAQEEEEADEELVRLEGELEVARQDLESYRPRTRRTTSNTTSGVEEVNRSTTGGTGRQVTLSGSYRIPIPANVNLEDVQTIKSGVSAAQNVARSFLEQRRALRGQDATPPSHSSTTRPANQKPATTNTSSQALRPKRSMSSNLEVAVDNSEGKQSWSEWIGGYSMAITRAVGKIEHEAALEAKRSAGASGGGSAPVAGRKKTSAAATPRKAGVPTGKRPAVKATLSGEQVHGLMS